MHDRMLSVQACTQPQCLATEFRAIRAYAQLHHPSACLQDRLHFNTNTSINTKDK
jgi:hypothetical protein